MEEYKKGVDELQFSVVGRNYLQKGKEAPTTMELKMNLASNWGLENFKLIPMGGGLLHVLLKIMEEKSRALSHGPVNLPSRIF